MELRRTDGTGQVSSVLTLPDDIPIELVREIWNSMPGRRRQRREVEIFETPYDEPIPEFPFQVTEQEEEVVVVKTAEESNEETFAAAHADHQAQRTRTCRHALEQFQYVLGLTTSDWTATSGTQAETTLIVGRYKFDLNYTFIEVIRDQYYSHVKSEFFIQLQLLEVDGARAVGSRHQLTTKADLGGFIHSIREQHEP